MPWEAQVLHWRTSAKLEQVRTKRPTGIRSIRRDLVEHSTAFYFYSIHDSLSLLALLQVTHSLSPPPGDMNTFLLEQHEDIGFSRFRKEYVVAEELYKTGVCRTLESCQQTSHVSYNTLW